MKQAWPFVPIEAFSLPTFQRDPRELPDELFRYVDISMVDRETKSILALAVLRGAEAPSRARKEIRGGDVLVSTVRPNLNSVCLVPDSLDGQIASTGFCVLRGDPRKVKERFLFYYTMTPDFIRYLTERTSGASYPAVSDSIVKSAVMPLPPLPEQERIVRLLDAAEESRRLRAAADRRTADLIPALFYGMFGDLSRNTHGSLILPFSELAQEFRYGTSTKSTGVGKPTLRIPNVIGNTLRLDDLKFVSITEEEYEAWRLRDGDLVFVRTNGNADFIGRSAVFDSREISEAGHDPTEFIYASYLIRARLFLDRIEPHYLQQYLRSKDARAEIRKRARTSAGQYNINTVSLGSIPILVPPLSLQRQFAARVAEIRALETQQAASRRRLGDLFQSMLHRAFRGEL